MAGEIFTAEGSVASLGYLDMQPTTGHEALIQFVHASDAISIYYYSGGVYQAFGESLAGAGTLIFDPPLRCTNTKFYAAKNDALTTTDIEAVGLVTL